MVKVRDVIDTTRQTLTPSKQILKMFIVLFAVLCLAYAGLFREHNPYQDDYHRYIAGYRWGFDARSMQSLLYCTFSVSPKALVSGTLGLIFSLGLLAIMSIGLIRLFNMKWSWWVSLAVLVLGVAPFISQNMLYQYDAMGMLWALLFAILPLFYQRKLWPTEVFLVIFAALIVLGVVGLVKVWPLWLMMIGLWTVLVISKKRSAHYVAITLLSLVSVMYTYQSALGAYLVLVLMFAVYDLLQIDKKPWDIFKSLLGQLVLVLSLFILVKLLQKTGIPGLVVTNYLGAQGTELLPWHTMLPTVAWRFVVIGGKIVRDWFSHNLLGYAMLGLVLTWLGLVIQYILRTPKKQRWVRLALLGAICVALILSCFISTLFFTTFVKQYRTMYALNVLFTVMAFQALFLVGISWQRWLVRGFISALLFMSLHYTSALHYVYNQVTRYTESVLMSTIDEVYPLQLQYPDAELVINYDDATHYPFLAHVDRMPTPKAYPAMRANFNMYHKTGSILDRYGYKYLPVTRADYPNQTLLKKTVYADIYLLGKDNESIIFLEWRPS